MIVIYATSAIFASVGMLMLTTRGELTTGLLVGGLSLLFSMFAVLHRGRIWKLVKALKYNWKIAREARTENRIFENAYMKMQESGSCILP